MPHVRHLSLVALAGLMLAASSQAADLRTTTGQALVVRKISHQQGANDAKPMPARPMQEPAADTKKPAEQVPRADQAQPAEGIAPQPEELEGTWEDSTFELAPGVGSECATCGRWASVEYLLWWRRGADLPALVTTSPANTAQANAGVLGLSSTTVLFGGQRADSESSPGGRFSLGYWVDPCRTVGYGVRFFSMGDDDFSYTVGPNDFPITARPFYNASTNQQDARLVNFPGSTQGTIAVTGTSEVLGGDVFFRKAWCQTSCARLDLIAGYQFSRIDESVRVDSQTVVVATGGTIPQGTVVDEFDLFEARNEFHGGAVGLMAEWDRGCWSLRMLAKVGLGNMRQRMSISGQAVTAVPGGSTSTRASGLLAQPSNMGVFEQNEFAVVPEFGVKFSWDIFCNTRLHVGYSALYWDAVLQPGSHMDLAVNPTQLPGPISGDPAPIFAFRPTSYWVHGLNFGLSTTF